HSERGPAIPGYLKALFKKAELAQRLVMKLDIPRGYGVRANTLRIVLLPLIAAALAFGKRKPDGSLVANVKRLSLRTLEWLTGLHRNTVWKALKRLTQGIEIAGVKVEVSKQEHRGMRLAPVYKVTISAQLLSDGILQICDTAEGVRHRSAVSLGSVTSLQFSHDAFRRKRRGTALGKTDYFVLIALSELSSAVVSELAERLKLNHTTVWRSLRKLESYGVVKRIDKHGKAVIWAIGELSEMKLDEVADLCGVTGKRKRTAILHARERKEHDEDFERWVTAPPQKRIRKMDLKAAETSQGEQWEQILVLSFDGDHTGLIEEFEKEAPDLACQTLRVKRGDGRLQLWFRYNGGFKPRSWLIGKARVELKKEVPRVKEGDISLNDKSIAKITDEQVQRLIAWLGEQAGSKNFSALRKFQSLRRVIIERGGDFRWATRER
nr:winged helix-turn-helix transcriptional regulator [Candidatus Sigynarchaeota archaeon]